MYTLLELESKTFGELKKIADELNVLPEGDRRRRQSWIEAIAGVNPPLLQLLSVSAAVEVQAQEPPIIETVETSPGVEVEPVSSAPLESKFGRIVYPRPVQEAITTPKFQIGDLVQSMTMTWGLEKKSMTGTVLERLPRGGVRVQFGNHISGYGGTFDFSKSQLEDLISVQDAIEPIDALVNTSQRQDAIEPIDALVNTSQRQDAISQVAKICTAVEVEQAQEAISPIAKTSPAASVEQAQEAIEQATENFPGVEIDRVSEEIELGEQKIEDYFDINELWELDQADCPACGGVDSLRARWSQEYSHGFWIIYCNECDSTCSCSIELLPPCLRGDDDDADSEDSPGVDVDRAQEPSAEAAKNSPGVEVDPLEDFLPECSECFGDGYVEDEFGCIKFCQCEPKLSRQKTQRAIAPETDPNPILTGVVLSDRFVARYAPPQSETLSYEIADGYKADTDGQLSLFDVQVVTEPEPPDPDDFESLDAFQEAIARWDREHPSSFDHCSHYLPSSVHCEPNSVHCEPDSVHCEPDSVHCEPLEVSLDSFCEWAPCPVDWYEPAALLEVPEVSELSAVPKSSITSDFFISTFGRWGARPDRRDEPPDTGLFAKRPKPKPPHFPPQAIWTQLVSKLNTSQSQVRPPETIPKLSRNYPETIPKLFHCVAAGSTTQPARSPPGGDAMT